MQDLQSDFAAFRMYRVSDLAVPAALFRRDQRRAMLHRHALGIGRDAAGDDQRDAFARALAIKCGKALGAVGMLFQSGMHRAHQEAVAQLRKPQVERGEQGRVGMTLHGGITQVKWSDECNVAAVMLKKSESLPRCEAHQKSEP